MKKEGMDLKSYLKLKGQRQKEFAVLIGRSRATVSNIVRGSLIPDGKTMLAIQKVTDGAVQPNDLVAAAK
jgi:transcriptional regulator with XRE-family HTH domain